MIYMTLLQIIYLGHVEFFGTRASRSLEIINESIFVLIQYNFVLLNNLVSKKDIRERSGNVIVALTGSLLLINMAVIVVVSIKAVIWKCHLRKLKKQKLREFKEKKVRDEFLKTIKQEVQENKPPVEEKKQSQS